MNKITVYIPCHNHEKFINDAIESVLRQTYKNWELFIIDDASTDKSFKKIQIYKSHPKIKIFKTKGIGLPKVCNLAIKKSTGNYVIRLDGDDIFNENILEIMFNTFQKQKSLAMIFPDYVRIDQWSNILSYERRSKVDKEIFIKDLPPNGACMMIKKSVLSQLGGYREDLGAQDGLDIWSKIKDKFPVLNINLPLFYYRQHEKNLTSNIKLIDKARKKIISDASRKKIKKIKPVFCVLPCRKFFNFKKNLWNEKLGTKTLLENQIEILLKSKLIDKIIVACDDWGAEKIVRKFNKKKVSFFKRDYKDTFVSKGLYPTLVKINKKFNKKLKGITLVKHFQTPFVKLSTIEESINTLAYTNSDSIITVQLLKDPIYRRQRYGLEPINTQSELQSEYNQIFLEKNICSVFQNKNLVKGSIFGIQVSSIKISPEESFFIDNSDNYQYAKKLLKKRS